MAIAEVPSRIYDVFPFIDPLVGLVLVVCGVALVRRNRDPGLKLLVAWGAL
ncbi:MAG: hypothetical protein AB2385_03610 [Symbiobacterium sp.]|uniref:hypothetical protein n=1 Tax=Symbiobacterium sp. TaxID=1971213 RepID=UPI00346439B2